MNLDGYIRVSSIGQRTDGFGLDVQRAAIAKWAKARGHGPARVCEDVDSGKRPPEERPGLTEALDDLRPPPKACGLVIPLLDRLARTLSIQEAVLRVAWRARATVFTADQGEILANDPSDPMRTAMRQMAGVLAELDRALLVKRMAEGRAAKTQAGRHAVGEYPVRLPRWGYRTRARCRA